MTRTLGLDPGNPAGLVAIDHDGPLLQDWHWVGSWIIHASTNPRLPAEQRDFDYLDRLALLLQEIGPATVVIESPEDVQDSWNRQRKGKRHARGTEQRQGVHYALALAATRTLRPLPTVVTYPVRAQSSVTKRGRLARRRGWMGLRSASAILREMAMLARSLGATDLQDHELMALGLVVHHEVTMVPILPTEAR